MKSIKYAFAAIIFLLPSVSHGSKSYEFLRDVIESVGTYSSAYESYDDDMDKMKTATDMMTAVLRMRERIEEAKYPLKKYISSKNKVMADSSVVIIQSYSTLIEYNKQTLNQMEQMLNTPQKPGTQARQTAEISAGVSAVQKNLVQAVILSQYAIFDMEKSEGKEKTELAISKKELLELRKQFNTIFGKNAQKEFKTGVSYVRAAEAAIWKILKQDWPTKG